MLHHYFFSSDLTELFVKGNCHEHKEAEYYAAHLTHRPIEIHDTHGQPYLVQDIPDSLKMF